MGQIFETGYEVNVSHIIHDLSFGPTYPGVHNPLDGSERILHDTSGTFKYFLKVGCAGYVDGRVEAEVTIIDQQMWLSLHTVMFYV